MRDHHVDRPGVDVRQRTQLTGPNRPTGSRSPPCTAASPPKPHTAFAHTHTRVTNSDEIITRTRTRPGYAGRPGGHGGGRAPDPIPNSAVKTPSAYDTVPQGTGKSVAARSSSLSNTTNAGWSSPVARQAHNLKAAGSNPAPATSLICSAKTSDSPDRAACAPVASCRIAPNSPRTSIRRHSPSGLCSRSLGMQGRPRLVQLIDMK